MLALQIEFLIKPSGPKFSNIVLFIGNQVGFLGNFVSIFDLWPERNSELSDPGTGSHSIRATAYRIHRDFVHRPMRSLVFKGKNIDCMTDLKAVCLAGLARPTIVDYRPVAATVSRANYGSIISSTPGL